MLANSLAAAAPRPAEPAVISITGFVNDAIRGIVYLLVWLGKGSVHQVVISKSYKEVVSSSPFLVLRLGKDLVT